MQLNEALKKLKNIYGNMIDWSGHCASISNCKAICCTNSFEISYVEFEFAIKFLKENYSLEEIKKILIREPQSKSKDVIAIPIKKIDFEYSFDSKEKESCRFLSGIECLIYEARMYACRAYKNMGNKSSPVCVPDWEFGNFVKENFKAAKRITGLVGELDLPSELKLDYPLDFWVSRYLVVG